MGRRNNAYELNYCQNQDNQNTKLLDIPGLFMEYPLDSV